MAVPKKKTSKRRKRNRRSHHKLAEKNLSKCPNCNSPKLPHRPCPVCGKYKGKVVLEKVK